MAGGIDWFRWHHGSVTDPKFKLVSKRAGVRLGDVIAFWAMLLEQASLAEVRGVFGSVDFEAIDLELDLFDGASKLIYQAMIDRKLISDGSVLSWNKRQVKREREDDNSTARSQKHREKQRENQQTNDGVSDDATPRNATQRQETPRVEKSREELKDIAPQAALPKQKRAPSKTSLPENFSISDRVDAWAQEKGYEFLDLHFEHFISACKSRGYTYADWDEAFMRAIRDNWAKLNPAQVKASVAIADRPPKPDGDYVWRDGRWIHRNFLGVK